MTDLPLTARQTLVWVDEQLHGDVPYRTHVLTLRMRGALDGAAFRRALVATLSAFDSFRIVITVRDGEPRQRMLPELAPTLHDVDLREHPEALEAWVAERCVRRFDLSRCLFDAALIRVREDEHVFYLAQHHLIADPRSISLVVDELARAYRGDAVAMRPSFADYVRLEHDYRHSERAAVDAAVVARKVARVAPLRWYGRPADLRGVGVTRSVVDCGAEREARLMTLTRDTSARFGTEDVARLVAFATALFAYQYRVGESRALAVAAAFPNRTAAFAQTAGLLHEQVFLVVEVDDGETFGSLADKVRAEVLSSFQHGQHCSGDRGMAYSALIVDELVSPAMPGLVTEASLRQATETAARFAGIEGDTHERVALHLIGGDSGTDVGSPLRIGFAFHRETFDAVLQERAKGHFLAVLDAMLGNLDTALDDVDLVSPEERRALLTLGRGAAPGQPAPDLALRFAEVCARRPEHAAVIVDGTALTYAALKLRVEQLAGRLLELDVTPGARVGICMPRGSDELVAMLAVLWVGASYVPLDAAHPSARLRMILEDAAPQVLLTHSTLAVDLDAQAGVRRVLVDREADALKRRAPAPLRTELEPDQAAYVLFTSGSTGRPKGVVVPRRALNNFLRSMAHTPGMHEDDRCLAVTTTSFDISQLELLLPLWVGACVQIADRETMIDAAKLRAVLERDPITVMQATPPTWRLLLEAGYTGAPKTLRKLCGGEALSPELASRLLATGGELWNLYGPTETTVWSTLKRLDPASVKRISIGRPIDHTQVYVLDHAGAVVPQGVVGELCIGGAGVALGYLDRPELTAEKFIANPQGDAQDRVYRTGDLARVLPDGELECLGRVDFQVKVRGYRIELGEIESCMRGVSGVQEAVVVAKASGDDLRLVAYWVGGATRDAVASHVRARLPSHMHPAFFVHTDALPLNTNGKLDRKRLPEPVEEALPEGEGEFADDVHTQMAALFAEALERASVSGDADFFALGGDSLQLLRLRRRVKDTFGVELSLEALFDMPTVRRLCAALGPREDNKEVFVRLRQGRSDRAPLVCILGVAIYHPLAQTLGNNHTVYGVHVPLDSASKIPPTVESVARSYVQAIEAQLPSGPLHLAGLCFGGVVAFEVARQLRAAKRDVRSVAAFDAILERGIRRSPARLVKRVFAVAREDPRSAAARISQRAADHLRARFLPGGGDARAVYGERNELGLDVERSIIDAYTRTPPSVDRPMAVFRALESDHAAWLEIDDDLGWRDMAKPLEVFSVQGDHLTLLRRPHVADVARALTSFMDRHERDA